jgi:hypothetical protein
MYSDLNIPVLSTEASMMGKPSVVCGYPLLYPNIIKNIYPMIHLRVRASVTVFLKPDPIDGDNSDLYNILKNLISDKLSREYIGLNARRYYEECCKPETVARVFLDIINDNIEERYMMRPSDIVYIHGCGCPEWHLLLLYREIYAKYGIDGFCIRDRPDIENAILDFIENSKILLPLDKISK